MTKSALINQLNEVKELWHKLDRSNLNRFHLDFLNLYNNVLSEYDNDKKEHSDFYHIRKVLTMMSEFSGVPEKRKDSEMSEIRSLVGPCFRDLQQIISHLKEL